VTWVANTVITDEEKRYLKTLALELADIRRQLDQLAEALSKLNDKQFFKMFCEDNDKGDLTEKQVDKYQLALQKQADAAESEFRY
jgi:hypothetical protein